MQQRYLEEAECGQRIQNFEVLLHAVKAKRFAETACEIVQGCSVEKRKRKRKVEKSPWIKVSFLSLNFMQI